MDFEMAVAMRYRNVYGRDMKIMEHLDFPDVLTVEENKFIEDWVEKNSDPDLKLDFKEAIVAFLKVRYESENFR